MYYFLDITFISYTFGLNLELDSSSRIMTNGKSNTLTGNIKYSSDLAEPNLRFKLYRRKYDQVYTSDYEEVNLTDYARFFTCHICPNLIEFQLLGWKDPLEKG